jgi:transketolase
MRANFISRLFEWAKNDKRVVILTGDLGYGALEIFFDSLPKQIYNLGIAEQSIVGIASGLASSGYRVFIYSIANFVSFRVLEQIRNDLSYHSFPVTIISVGPGYAYGQLGFTHHATEDISIIRSIPNITILNPSTDKEMDMVFPIIQETDKPCYLRLEKNSLVNVASSFYTNLESSINCDQSRIPIFVTGIIREIIINHFNQFPEHIDKFNIYSFPIIKPLVIQSEVLNNIVKSGHLIVLEEHNLAGGFGSTVMEELNLKGIEIPLSRIYRIGINDTFIKVVGSREHLWSLNKFSENFAKISNKLIKGIY